MCLAIPGCIVNTVEGAPDLAVVEVLGVRRTIDLGLLADNPPSPGDWVLIHVGFAMSRISETDAADQLRLLTELGEQQTAEDEVRGYDADAAGARAGP